MGTATQMIPDTLIYEMQDGVPIYYRGFQSYLDGEKKLDEIMGSSLLQSLIISRLVFLLQSQLQGKYEVLTNEIGVQFAKNAWRAADIAIVPSEKLSETAIANTYLNFAPEVVIEVDTKADLQSIQNPLSYYHEKTDEFLQFGISKVIWIFTDSGKVMVAERNKKWETSDWETEIEVIQGIMIGIADVLETK